MEFLKKKFFIILFIAAFFIIVAFSFSKDFIYKIDFLANALYALNLGELPKKLENPPAIIKSVYATGWSAGSKNYRNYLNELFKTTQINAVVIDIKDASGVVSYRTGAEMAKKYKAYWPEISNINSLVREFHNQGIYVIGRIVVFEDVALAKSRPDLAVYDKSKTKDKSQPVLWGNRNGLSWVDPASQEVWDYNISIAKDAASHGFDEINFDYVRFPTDGQLSNMGFPIWDQKTPKYIVIKNFFKKLRESFPDTKISVDLFGLTAVNTDDLGVGQIIEDSFDYFDYVCPMLYPSHYANGFMSFENPAEYPYEVVKYSMEKAILKRKFYSDNLLNKTENKLAKIRPWLQDFDMGAVYDTNMVKQEIKAVAESMGEDFSGFMLWSPSNIYTKGAIIKEESVLK